MASVKEFQKNVMNVLTGLFAVGVSITILPSLHAQNDSGYPTETTRVYYESKNSEYTDQEERYLEFTATERVGDASVGEEVSLEVTVEEGEDMGPTNIYGVLTTEEEEIIEVAEDEGTLVMSDSVTINITTTIPEDIEGDKLLFKGHARSVLAINARPDEDDINPSPDKDQYLQVGQVTGERSESESNGSENSTSDSDEERNISASEYPTETNTNYYQNDQNHYQRYTATERIGEVSVGEEVTTQVEVEASGGATDNITYGVLGTEEGEVIAVENMGGLGSGTITITTTIPEEARGNLLLFKGDADYSASSARSDYTGPSPDNESVLLVGEVTGEGDGDGEREEPNRDDTVSNTGEEYTASGTVTQNSEDGEPIANAEVSFREETDLAEQGERLSNPYSSNAQTFSSVTTDENGEWQKEGLQGEVSVSVSHEAYEFSSSEKTVSSENITANFTSESRAPLSAETMSYDNNLRSYNADENRYRITDGGPYERLLDEANISQSAINSLDPSFQTQHTNLGPGVEGGANFLNNQGGEEVIDAGGEITQREAQTGRRFQSITNARGYVGDDNGKSVNNVLNNADYIPNVELEQGDYIYDRGQISFEISEEMVGEENTNLNNLDCIQSDGNLNRGTAGNANQKINTVQELYECMTRHFGEFNREIAFRRNRNLVRCDKPYEVRTNIYQGTTVNFNCGENAGDNRPVPVGEPGTMSKGFMGVLATDAAEDLEGNLSDVIGIGLGAARQVVTGSGSAISGAISAANPIPTSRNDVVGEVSTQLFGIVQDVAGLSAEATVKRNEIKRPAPIYRLLSKKTLQNDRGYFHMSSVSGDTLDRKFSHKANPIFGSREYGYKVGDSPVEGRKLVTFYTVSARKDRLKQPVLESSIQEMIFGHLMSMRDNIEGLSSQNNPLRDVVYANNTISLSMRGIGSSRVDEPLQVEEQLNSKETIPMMKERVQDEVLEGTEDDEEVTTFCDDYFYSPACLTPQENMNEIRDILSPDILSDENCRVERGTHGTPSAGISSSEQCSIESSEGFVNKVETLNEVSEFTVSRRRATNNIVYTSWSNSVNPYTLESSIQRSTDPNEDNIIQPYKDGNFRCPEGENCINYVYQAEQDSFTVRRTQDSEPQRIEDGSLLKLRQYQSNQFGSYCPSEHLKNMNGTELTLEDIQGEIVGIIPLSGLLASRNNIQVLQPFNSEVDDVTSPQCYYEVNNVPQVAQGDNSVVVSSVDDEEERKQYIPEKIQEESALDTALSITGNMILGGPGSISWCVTNPDDCRELGSQIGELVSDVEETTRDCVDNARECLSNIGETAVEDYVAPTYDTVGDWESLQNAADEFRNDIEQEYENARDTVEDAAEAGVEAGGNYVSNCTSSITNLSFEGCVP